MMSQRLAILTTSASTPAPRQTRADQDASWTLSSGQSELGRNKTHKLLSHLLLAYKAGGGGQRGAICREAEPLDVRVGRHALCLGRGRHLLDPHGCCPAEASPLSSRSLFRQTGIFRF